MHAFCCGSASGKIGAQGLTCSRHGGDGGLSRSRAAWRAHPATSNQRVSAPTTGIMRMLFILMCGLGGWCVSARAPLCAARGRDTRGSPLSRSGQADTRNRPRAECSHPRRRPTTAAPTPFVPGCACSLARVLSQRCPAASRRDGACELVPIRPRRRVRRTCGWHRKVRGGHGPQRLRSHELVSLRARRKEPLPWRSTSVCGPGTDSDDCCPTHAHSSTHGRCTCNLNFMSDGHGPGTPTSCVPVPPARSDNHAHSQRCTPLTITGGYYTFSNGQNDESVATLHCNNGLITGGYYGECATAGSGVCRTRRWHAITLLNAPPESQQTMSTLRLSQSHGAEPHYTRATGLPKGRCTDCSESSGCSWTDQTSTDQQFRARTAGL